MLLNCVWFSAPALMKRDCCTLARPHDKMPADAPQAASLGPALPAPAWTIAMAAVDSELTIGTRGRPSSSAPPNRADADGIPASTSLTSELTRHPGGSCLGPGSFRPNSFSPLNDS